ncbi:MAG: hypothetical protein ACP5E2_00265 [Terracidiphilus sp.]
MNDTDSNDLNAKRAAGDQSAGSGDELPVSRFEVVPSKETNQEDLYSFRQAMEPEREEPANRQSAGFSANLLRILLLPILLAGGAYIYFTFPNLFQLHSPAPNIDMGSRQFDPAGLSGRLIVSWEKSASYQLFVDPQSQAQTAGFAAVALDPPRQLSVTIRLKNADGLVACQKEILLPVPASLAPDANSGDALAPQKTETGDTVQNMPGKDGHIAEIDITGPLPCSAKAYDSFKSWNFTTDFPSLAEQSDWLLHPREPGARGRSRNHRPSARAEKLAAPIEGNDVIVADNPSRGTVETSGGRVFYLGAAGMRNRTAEWQIFPAPIHYRCDKTGSCTLTRTNSLVALHARLLQ